MLTNKQSLYLSGVVLIGFFIAGLCSQLDNLIVQIILSSLFVLIIINLFMVKKEPEEIEDTETKKDIF